MKLLPLKLVAVASGGSMGLILSWSPSVLAIEFTPLGRRKKMIENDLRKGNYIYWKEIGQESGL